MTDFGYTKEEIALFRKLNTPQKIQDYINKIPFNFEKGGETCMSPRKVIQTNKAHCMEGALLASAILEFHGHKPLLIDLRSSKNPYDDDHILAVFKKYGCFGAVSKTNHSVLRYREPVYRTLRELVMSFFHEYFLVNGFKTLREYSGTLNLNTFNKIDWRTSDKDLFQIPSYIDKIRHFKVISKEQEKNLRKAEKIEIKGSWEEEHKKR